MRRDHDDQDRLGQIFRGQPAGQVESALPSQLDVDQGDLGVSLAGLAHRADRVGGHRDDHETPALQRLSRDLEEAGVVVDQQAAYSHELRLARRGPGQHRG
jgi:hypothetical protein